MGVAVFLAGFGEDDFAAGLAAVFGRAGAGFDGPLLLGLPAGFSRLAAALRFNSAATALAAASFSAIGARCTCTKRTWSPSVW
jgi:hypothetical protein